MSYPSYPSPDPLAAGGAGNLEMSSPNASGGPPAAQVRMHASTPSSTARKDAAGAAVADGSALPADDAVATEYVYDVEDDASPRSGVRASAPAQPAWAAPPLNGGAGGAPYSSSMFPADAYVAAHPPGSEGFVAHVALEMEMERAAAAAAASDPNAVQGYEPASVTNIDSPPNSGAIVPTAEGKLPASSPKTDAKGRPETVASQAAKARRLGALGAVADDDDDSATSYAYGTYATFTLILVFLALFLAEFGLDPQDAWKIEDPYINPSIGPSYAALDKIGGKIGFKVLGHTHLSYGSGSAQGYRLVSSILWHSGIIHFVPHMFVLLWAGCTLEREYGGLRILLLFVGSAIFGTIFSSLFVVDLLTVSASAGTFGLLGAKVVDAWLYRDWYERNYLNYINAFGLAGVGLVLGCLPLIDNWAHVGGMWMGGLFAGALFTGGWRPAPDSNVSNVNLNEALHTRRYKKIRIISLIIGVTAWVLALILLFTVVENTMARQSVKNPASSKSDVWCTSCNKFQCVETSTWTCRPSYYH